MRGAGRLVLVALAVAAPWLVAAVAPGQQRYIVHVLVYTALFATLALSYDLVVGHVGALSLAHPAFFGVGAYTAAILATRLGWPFLADVVAAVLVAGAVAAVAGVPLFRLTEHAFAVGTLGFAVVASIVATNWVEVTRGPLCITGIPKPVTTLPAWYWLALTALGAVVLLYRGLTTFRIGRALHAVRDNESLAASAAIDPLRYRMLAFTVGGALAGGVGAIYAHYLSVFCPEEMTVALTVNLLVIVFLGGVGTLRGVLIGAVLFTALPEVLRLAPTWRLVIYGLLLLVIVVRSPAGLDGLLARRAGAPAR
ncbi:MAG TPA: branched-chain amino acid ABC transporter permease [Candidatus Acidoferrum sp.]|jgi:ABC-type branched-subunit amino acid transport system permease subunit|nr:branched-chain amino acid ABC transporter permease [Candidatus Acidoferrum sp.]